MEKEDILNKWNRWISTWDKKERTRVSCHMETLILVGS